MESLLEFAKGPMFRFAFAILILGLIRLIVLAIINGLEAKSRGKDKKIPKHYVRKLTWGFLIPIRSFRVKPLYSVVSILFHIGLIATPLLLWDHAWLFQQSIDIGWTGITISHELANWLTILTIITGVILLLLRASTFESRFLSRKQDFLWPILLIIPFVTGYVCANSAIEPATYNAYMLIHVLAGNIIFILIPFTKIAHCVLMPLSQWITARSWKFPPEAGEQVAMSFGKENEEL
jgi:nitrate reductase gamma subunit